MYIAILVAMLTAQASAQEVITNQEGRKIVVDAEGNWQYFNQDSVGVADASGTFQVPTTDALQREKRLEETQRREAEISLELIERRNGLIQLMMQSDSSQANSSAQHQRRIETVQKKIKQLEKSLQVTRSRLELLREINELPQPVYDKKLEVWEKEHPEEVPMDAKISKNLASNNKRLDDGIAYGILLLPTDQPCELGISSIDSPLNDFRWGTAPKKLFSYTDVSIEPQFKKRDFIDCVGYLTAMEGGLKYLNLEIAVASLKAPQIFGHLPVGEYVEVQLLNGEKVHLFNKLPSNGHWVAAQDAFFYKGRYIIGNKEEKMLRSSEVDRVLLRWSLVQESYQVYETDFFVRQFDCLDALIENEN